MLGLNKMQLIVMNKNMIIISNYKIKFNNQEQEENLISLMLLISIMPNIVLPKQKMYPYK